MLNNFTVWLNVLQKKQPVRHFWAALAPKKKKVRHTSPWSSTQRRYNDFCFLYNSKISYSEWISNHYFD